MYNVSRGILHGLASFLLFAIPFLLTSHSAFLDLTIGSVLNGFYHYLLAEHA